jgi:hypothetical protein
VGKLHSSCTQGPKPAFAGLEQFGLYNRFRRLRANRYNGRAAATRGVNSRRAGSGVSPLWISRQRHDEAAAAIVDRRAAGIASVAPRDLPYQ